jgi:hypothetical protein
MERAPSLHFAAVVRLIAAETRRAGLAVPAFVSPPRVRDADRTLRFRPDGAAVVAVRYRDRPFSAVVADLVEGVVAANRLTGAAAEASRGQLAAALEGEVDPVAA